MGEGSYLIPWVRGRARGRLAELEGRFRGRGAGEVAGLVRGILAGHEELVERQGLVLYAGTNATSPLVRSMLGASIESRPSMGDPGEKYQTFLEYVEELEVLATDLMCRAFGARYAEVRVQSGTLANLAVYSAFVEPGERIAVLPEAGGGHISHHAYGVPGIRGVEVVELPFSVERMNVDLELCAEALDHLRPKLIVLGASLFLFPHPVGRIRELADEIGALVVYDAAHVDGLLAGGEFQRPLKEGAHLVTSSTYKSLGGPSGGAIMTDEPELARRVSETVYPGMTANYNAGRLAALSVALAEALEFGRDYARACIANARALARTLDECGLSVAGGGLGYTDSHHTAFDAAPFGGGDNAARRLAAAGIYTSGIGLPWQRADEPYRGVRLVTQELTRRGMGEGEMERVAQWISGVLLDGRDPLSVSLEVAELRREFDSFEYCYPDPQEAVR